MTVGERIKARRKELGMSQEELCSRVGYKEKATISKIEKDGRTLRQSKILLFADALQVSPLYLLTGEDAPDPYKKPDAKEIEYAELVSQLTDEEKQDVLDYIRYLMSKKK